MKSKILKLLKIMGIFLFIVFVVLAVSVIFITNQSDPDSYFGIKKEARSILFGISGNTKKADKELVKVQKMENSWREFDFRDIQGETPDKGADPQGYPALSKYEIQDIQIYKDVAFVTGDNRNEVRTNSRTPMSLDKAEELMEAYVFRSTDGGKTFDKQCFGKRSALGIRKVNNDLYLAIGVHMSKIKSTLLKAKDIGDTWEEVNFIPWVVLNKGMMIQGSYGDEQITNNGGETWKKVSENLQAYLDKFPKYHRPIPYQDKLVKLQDRKLIFFDIETDKEEVLPLNVPREKILDKGTLHSDKETGELSIRLFPDIVGNPREEQGSIWFPLEDKEVVFDKKLPKPVFLEVHGKYIGGFTKVEGVLTHIWTLDKGETWNYELLPNYFWEKNISYGDGQIWMEVLLRGKDGFQNGSYLAIGKIKDYKEENK